ncbi:MAG: hypothetical protein P4L41_05335 [Flavipsychrobacter sp.]|nr:hypothetical protein [Flavipsychrobacter sp.]
MKITSLSVALLSATIAISACCNKPAGNGHTYSDSLSAQLYPVVAAQADIRFMDTLFTAFVSKYDTSVKYYPSPIKAFTISSTDLFMAMGIQQPYPQVQYNNIRVYLGYSKTAQQFRLFVVPVKSGINPPSPDSTAGSDMFIDVINNVPVISLTGHNVLDLNAPCPSFCDWQSRLMPTQMHNTKPNK